MPDTGPIFSLVPSYFVQNGDTLLPVQHNPVFEDVADALTNRVTRDGSGGMTGNLDMGGNRIAGMSEGTSGSDAAAVSQACPPGMIAEFPFTTAPTGWLALQGQSVNRSTYARLWSAVQSSGNLASSQGAKTAAQFGPGNGSSTFTLPDYRGYFRRGLNTSGSGIDPSRAIGAVQSSQNLQHNHGASSNSTGAHTHSVSGTAASSGAHSHSASSNSTGAHTHSVSGNTGNNGGHTHTASTNSTGAHTHSVSGTAASAGSHNHQINTRQPGGGLLANWDRVVAAQASESVADPWQTQGDGAHTHSVSGTAASAGSHSHTVSVGSVSDHNHSISLTSGSSGNHSHSITVNSNGAHTHSVSGTAASAGAHSHTITVANDGGSEARPNNIATLVCIKT